MSAIGDGFARILDGEASHDEMLAFLARSVEWMAEPAALVAGASAMRARMLRVQAPDGAMDVCGTGGDGAHTLNISTAVAFVVAGCGVPVAKHGNRAMSSRSGAADVLEALGVKLTADIPILERCLREARVAFLFAQLHHPALRHVAAARREFGRRTIFNLLGPLANPAGVKRQLLGVFAADYAAPVAKALDDLGCESAWVVHGAGGMDELSGQHGDTVFSAGACGVQRRDLDRELASIPPLRGDGVRGGSAEENAQALAALLSGEAPHTDYASIVLLNAAAALVVAGRATDLVEGRELADESLREGRAHAALERLVAITSAAP